MMSDLIRELAADTGTPGSSGTRPGPERLRGQTG